MLTHHLGTRDHMGTMTLQSKEKGRRKRLCGPAGLHFCMGDLQSEVGGTRVGPQQQQLHLGLSEKCILGGGPGQAAGTAGPSSSVSLSSTPDLQGCWEQSPSTCPSAVCVRVADAGRAHGILTPAAAPVFPAPRPVPVLSSARSSLALNTG